MVDSQFGHSMIIVDDYLAEADVLKRKWERMEPVLFDTPKYEIDALYERLDRATIKKFINEKCRNAKQELLIILIS